MGEGGGGGGGGGGARARGVLRQPAARLNEGCRGGEAFV